jgi:hypothetical protein
MHLILAIEPDRRQAAQIAAIAKNPLHAELVIAETAEQALRALGSRVPDLILTAAFLSPKDETVLAERLRELEAAADHVQVLTIPVLATSGKSDGGMLTRLRGSRKNAAAPDGCEPEVFAEQIAEYLKRGTAEREARAAAARFEQERQDREALKASERLDQEQRDQEANVTATDFEREWETAAPPVEVDAPVAEPLPEPPLVEPEPPQVSAASIVDPEPQFSTPSIHDALGSIRIPEPEVPLVPPEADPYLRPIEIVQEVQKVDEPRIEHSETVDHSQTVVSGFSQSSESVGSGFSRTHQIPVHDAHAKESTREEGSTSSQQAIDNLFKGQSEPEPQKHLVEPVTRPDESAIALDWNDADLEKVLAELQGKSSAVPTSVSVPREEGEKPVPIVDIDPATLTDPETLTDIPFVSGGASPPWADLPNNGLVESTPIEAKPRLESGFSQTEPAFPVVESARTPVDSIFGEPPAQELTAHEIAAFGLQVDADETSKTAPFGTDSVAEPLSTRSDFSAESDSTSDVDLVAEFADTAAVPEASESVELDLATKSGGSGFSRTDLATPSVTTPSAGAGFSRPDLAIPSVGSGFSRTDPDLPAKAVEASSSDFEAEAESWGPALAPASTLWPALEGSTDGVVDRGRTPAAPSNDDRPKPSPAPSGNDEGAQRVQDTQPVQVIEVVVPSSTETQQSRDQAERWMAALEELRREVEQLRAERQAAVAAAPAPAAAPASPAEPAREADPSTAAIVSSPTATSESSSSTKRSVQKQKPARKKGGRRKTTGVPPQDEWGFFDPEQYGFAALLEKLDEITGPEEPPPTAQ